MSSYPSGYDIVVHIEGLYGKGDEVKYWGAMPGTTSSQNRAFHEVDNVGTVVVRDDGSLVLRARTPRPFVSKKTGKVMPRCLYMKRRRRGRYANQWCDKVHAIFLLTDSRVKRIEKVRSIQHGLFTDEKKGFAVAENRREAGRLQRQGVVEVYIQRKINHK